MDKDETIDIDFFVRRLQQAQQWRDWLAQRDGLDSYRLIAGESDGLPGVTIDRFGNFLVLQLLSAGAEYQRPALLSALQHCYPECAIYDRSDVAVRKKEGLELTQGPVSWVNCRLPCCRLNRARHEAAGGYSGRAQNRLLPRPARQPPGDPSVCLPKSVC